MTAEDKPSHDDRRDAIRDEAGSQSSLLARLLVLLAIVVAAYFLISFGNLVVASYRLGREESALRGRIEALNAEYKILVTRDAELQTDAGIERLAREQLGMVRPGETPVRLVRSSLTPVPTIVPSPTPDRRTNIDRAWDWFFGRGR